MKPAAPYGAACIEPFGAAFCRLPEWAAGFARCRGGLAFIFRHKYRDLYYFNNTIGHLEGFVKGRRGNFLFYAAGAGYFASL